MFADHGGCYLRTGVSTETDLPGSWNSKHKVHEMLKIVKYSPGIVGGWGVECSPCMEEAFWEVGEVVFSRDSVCGVMRRTQALEWGILGENPLNKLLSLSELLFPFSVKPWGQHLLGGYVNQICMKCIAQWRYFVNRHCWAIEPGPSKPVILAQGRSYERKQWNVLFWALLNR